MTLLYLDIETRSEVDLPFHGLYRYAECESTSLISMAFAFDDQPIQFWTAKDDFPTAVLDHIHDGGVMVAHNAEFERIIFDYVVSQDYNFAPPSTSQWRCSMTMAMVSGYPAGLDSLGTALNLNFKKNPEGKRLIREYCASGHADIFAPENEADLELMREYNISDVAVMREAVKHLRELSEEEWASYHTSCRINDRGIPVDTDLCESALTYTHSVSKDANAHIFALTSGAIESYTQRKARDIWLKPRLTQRHTDLLSVYKKGEKKMSFDYAHRQYLLDCDDLDIDVRKLINYTNDAGSSALKKYAVAAHQQVNDRVHSTFTWNGATTGRFSGRGLQPHNIRRDVYPPKEAERYIEAILEEEKLEQPAETMGRLLRAMIHHEDGLYWVDWSAIEGRVAPWLANSTEGNVKLDIFRSGEDVYKVAAAKMFHIAQGAVDTDLRQTGKIAELALQFGGGHNALINMGKNYGKHFLEDEAKSHVVAWRQTNPWARTVWDDMDAAITRVMREPNLVVQVGRIAFQAGDASYLWVMLPSGRVLPYPQPRFESYTAPWGEERYGPTFQTNTKPAAGDPPLRKHIRGALVFQNCVQAVAADLLRDSLQRAEAAKLDIVAHVHDEIVGQGTPEDGEKLNEIMLSNVDWGEGLPLATGGVSTGTRYGK